jgi:hypothetical protein
MDIRKITKRAVHLTGRPFLPDAGRSRIKRGRLRAAGAISPGPQLDRRLTVRHNATIVPPGAPRIVGREAGTGPEA